MRFHGILTKIMRYGRVLLMAALALFILYAFRHSANPAAFAEPTTLQRSGGYGISVGSYLPSRPDLLNRMSMDWVKIYNTRQIADYPNHKILYRLEVAGYPPDWDLDAWTNGLYTFARELNQRGVDAVEIGNEPNLKIEWGGQTPDAARYVDVLRRAYTAFKQEAPHIIVVSAGLSPTYTAPDRSSVDDFEFAQQMLNLGAANYFDVFGYHPYGFDKPPEASPHTHPNSFRRTELMYNLLRRNGVNTEIWITEFGWIRNPAEDGVNCTDDPLFLEYGWATFSAETQAAYTRRAFEFAARNWPWAGPMFLWNLNWNMYDEGSLDMCHHMRWYAVLDRGGNPLPVVNELRNLPYQSGPVPSPGNGAQAAVPPPEPIYRPSILVSRDRLTRSAEAGCAGIMQLGSIDVRASGMPPDALVDIEAVNAPERPFVWTNLTEVGSSGSVDVFVDARGVQPGLYLIALNLRAPGTNRMTSASVRGWLLLHHPTTPSCREQLEGEEEG